MAALDEQRPKLDPNRALWWATIVGGLMAVFLPGLEAFRALGDHLYVYATCYGLLVAFVLWAGWQVKPPKRLDPPVGTSRFAPFAQPGTFNVWPRPELRQRLLDAVARGPISVAIGPSGAGKSVMLHLLREELTKVGTLSCAVTGGELAENEDAIASAVEAARSGQAGEPVVVVLDQFEQFLFGVETREERQRRYQLLVDEIDRWRAEHLKFVIGVRSEWYSELAFLGSELPALAQCVDVTPVPTDGSEGQTISLMAKRLAAILDAKGDVGPKPALQRAMDLLGQLDRRGWILPVEVQIVGATLERLKISGASVGDYIAENELGADAIIDEYFEQLVRRSPNKRVTMKLLLALSVRRRFRRAVRYPDLRDALYELPHDVREAHDYLLEQGVLIERDSRCELAHDYLADHFRSHSGRVLDPVDRDNIAFNADGSRSHDKEIVLKRETPTADLFGHLMFGLISALMALRLFAFHVSWLHGSSLHTRFLFRTDLPMIDLVYLPVFVAHGGWVAYVYLYYERVFRKLRQSKAQTLFSQATLVVMCACVVGAMIVPEAWLLGIGVGGFFLSVRIWSLGRRRDLNPIAADRLRKFGWASGGNLVFVIVAGILGIAITHSFLHTGDRSRFADWSAYEIPVAILAAYASLILAPTHVTQSATSRTLGLVDRR